MRRAPLYIIVFGLVVFGGIVFFTFSNNSISGTYVGGSSNDIGMIRLVEVEGGKLSGQFESITLTDDGTIKDGSGSLEGVTDGKNIALSIKASPSPIILTASGTRDADTITLTVGVMGKSPITGVFKKSDLKTLQTASDVLRTKSQTILTEKADAEKRKKIEELKQKIVANVDKTTKLLQNTNVSIDKILNAQHVNEKKYHDITLKVQAYYDKARSMPGDRNSVPRNQIIVAMNQGIIATDQVHIQVQSHQDQFNNAMDSIAKNLQQTQSACAACKDKSMQIPSCQQLDEEITNFTAKVKKARDVMSGVEQTYKTELKEQQGLDSVVTRY